VKIKYSEESEEEEAEEESEEAEEEEEASGNETDRTEEDGGDDDAPPPSDDDEDEEEEEEEAAARGGKRGATAALALIEQSTGRRGRAAIGAAAALFALATKSAADVADLKRDARAKEKKELLASATRYVPKATLTWLATQPLATIKGFVQQATKGAPIVHTDEGELLVPRAAAPGTEESLPKDVLDMINGAMAACPSSIKPEVFRKTLVDAHLAEHKKRLAAANGAPGRV
jgi:hypothetical protein